MLKIKNSQDILIVQEGRRGGEGGVGKAFWVIKIYYKFTYLRQCTVDANR